APDKGRRAATAGSETEKATRELTRQKTATQPAFWWPRWPAARPPEKGWPELRAAACAGMSSTPPGRANSAPRHWPRPAGMAPGHDRRDSPNFHPECTG